MSYVRGFNSGLDGTGRERTRWARPAPSAVPSGISGGPRMTQNEFRQLLEAAATGWSTGDVTLATGCFAPDAIYTEPPQRRYFRGRDDLFYSFGGEDPPPMSLCWHHVLFDEAAGIGAGEYTFDGE